MSKENDIVSRTTKEPIDEKTVGDAKDILLITGIGGFLGLSLSKALAQDYEIVGPDRDCAPNLGSASESLQHTFCIPCDLTSGNSVSKVMDELRKRFGKRIASVIHFSGYYDFTGEPNPLYEEVNVKGTRRLLHALQNFEVEQFIYASTMLVHASSEPGVPINEDWPLQPKWAYPQSKLETEQVVQIEHGAINYAQLRIAGVYTDHVQPPEWIETMVAQAEPADRFIEAYNRSLRSEHRQNRWGHFLNMAMGTWLATAHRERWLARQSPAESILRLAA